MADFIQLAGDPTTLPSTDAPAPGAVEQLGTAASKAGAVAVDAANKAGAIAVDAAKQAGAAASDAANQLGSAANTALSKVGAALESVGTAAGQAASSAGQAASAASKDPTSCVGSFGSVWSDLWSGTFSQASSDAAGALNACSQSVVTAFQSVVALFY